MRLDGFFLAYRSPYLFRLRPTFGEMRARFEERLAERTRMAQDLHDTVRQGIVSAAMQLHVAVDWLPANSPAKLRLSRVLELMRHLMEEGRNAVRGLRSSNADSDNADSDNSDSDGADSDSADSDSADSDNSDSDDLGQAFSRILQDLGIEGPIKFRVIVLGSARKLHPLIRDEVYQIGRELLVNAFRHSRASCIEVELEYAPKRFRMVVRDDGCGIDPQVLHAGRDGHRGLAGVRQRAKRVGARLRIWSRAAAGTEVALSVLNSIAFESGMVEKSAGC
ncbi:MAG TPA: histidine kinase [Terriglobales bacterium]|jgi:signal transduction histidine kinase|nr:histidine kinase [Terriglobales bacterium]